MKSVSRFLPVQRAGLAVAALIAITGILAFATTAIAQETTGRLAGTVTMKVDKSALPGVLVEAVHTPTGTRYSATTLSNGRFIILNVRVGGPYTIVGKLSGFKEQTVKGIEVALGEIRKQVGRAHAALFARNRDFRDHHLTMVVMMAAASYLAMRAVKAPRFMGEDLADAATWTRLMAEIEAIIERVVG